MTEELDPAAIMGTSNEAVMRATGKSWAEWLAPVSYTHLDVYKRQVLHHFPSKEALTAGLIEQVTEVFNSRLEAELAAEAPGRPGRWLRAYIRTIFSVQYEDINLIPALAAAVAADHRTLDQLRRGFEQSQRAAVEDGIDPTLATIIRLAVDGVVFTLSLIHI